MAEMRTELHERLCAILGSRNVYFQPPESVKMAYPCIVYERAKIDIDYANNRPYAHRKQYTLTVIDKNPDSPTPDALAALPSCAFERHFTSDNLHHDVFRIYF